MLDRSGEPWTEVDVEKLAKLYFTSPRIHVDKIALALGRTTGAVQAEVSRLGMAQPGAKLRICLGEVCGGRRRFSPRRRGIASASAALNQKFTGVHHDKHHRISFATEAR